MGAPAEVITKQLSKRLTSWAWILEDNTRAQAERQIVNVKGD